MTTVHFAIAAIPVSVYLMLIGGLRLRNRPLVTTGWRDMLTLGIAVSGLVAIGPMQLFFPADAAQRWHGWVWLALLVLYLLALTLLLLSCKPKLIAYGMDAPQFHEVLLRAARELDDGANWQADVLTLPNCGLQLAYEPSGTARVHQVVHVGAVDNLQDWIQLERAFAKLGATLSCPSSNVGWPLVIGGSLLLTAAIVPIFTDPAAALAQLREFLDR